MVFRDNEWGADYGYPCRYTPTICDGPVLRWQKGERDLQVSASRNGVMVGGHSDLMQSRAVDQLADLLTLASWVAVGLGKREEPADALLTAREAAKMAALMAGVAPDSN